MRVVQTQDGTWHYVKDSIAIKSESLVAYTAFGGNPTRTSLLLNANGERINPDVVIAIAQQAGAGLAPAQRLETLIATGNYAEFARAFQSVINEIVARHRDTPIGQLLGNVIPEANRRFVEGTIAQLREQGRDVSLATTTLGELANHFQQIGAPGSFGALVRETVRLPDGQEARGIDVLNRAYAELRVLGLFAAQGEMRDPLTGLSYQDASGRWGAQGASQPALTVLADFYLQRVVPGAFDGIGVLTAGALYSERAVNLFNPAYLTREFILGDIGFRDNSRADVLRLQDAYG
jgi:hypothetical protein